MGSSKHYAKNVDVRDFFREQVHSTVPIPTTPAAGWHLVNTPNISLIYSQSSAGAWSKKKSTRQRLIVFAAVTSTTARHAEKAQQAGEYTGLSQRYVEVQPPPLPADHPCALYPAPCATLPMTEELEAKMARHNVNQEMKTFLAQVRHTRTLK